MLGADHRLREALGEVHDLLENTRELASEDRAELRSAMRDIQNALSEGSTDTLSGSIAEGLRAAVGRFEDRHPRLTEVIGRIADSLSEMGI